MTAKRRTSAKRSRNSNTARKKNSGRRRSTGGQNSGGSALILVYDFFTGTYFGRVAVAAMFICLIVFLNLIISGDSFNLFFTLLGIELIITSAAGWLIFLLRDEAKN